MKTQGIPCEKLVIFKFYESWVNTKWVWLTKHLTVKGLLKSLRVILVIGTAVMTTDSKDTKKSIALRAHSESYGLGDANPTWTFWSLGSLTVG